MARPRTSDLRERILATALELFAEHGVSSVSMRQIAERLGVSKPALYYHFASRDDLLAQLAAPMIADVEAMVSADEQRVDLQPRELLAHYFDVTVKHRALTLALVRDLPALSALGLDQRIRDWRLRLTRLLAGPDADLAAQARAIVALGGLADCLVQLEAHPVDEVRTAALTAAVAALTAPAG